MPASERQGRDFCRTSEIRSICISEVKTVVVTVIDSATAALCVGEARVAMWQYTVNNSDEHTYPTRISGQLRLRGDGIVFQREIGVPRLTARVAGCTGSNRGPGGPSTPRGCGRLR